MNPSHFGIIPRGGKGLIDYVRQNATIPVIETGAGVCHVYFDKEGDVAKGAAIIRNAKTRRVSVCNALDCLIIDVPILSRPAVARRWCTARALPSLRIATMQTPTV